MSYTNYTCHIMYIDWLSGFREGAEDLVPPILPAAPPSDNEVLFCKWKVTRTEKFIQMPRSTFLCSGNIKRTSVQRRSSKVLRNSALNKILSSILAQGPRNNVQGPKQRKRTLVKFTKSKQKKVKCFLFVTNTHHCVPNKNSPQPVMIHLVRAVKVQYETK